MMQFQPLPDNVITAGIFTLTTQIMCEIRMRQRRLTDYLSALDEQFIMAEKARFVALADPQAAPRTTTFAQINREAVVFAIPYAGETAEDDSDQKRLFMVNKLPQRVAMSAPPFLVQGDMHLLRETSLRDALLAVRQAFVPITNAQAIYLPTGQRFTAGIIIVNRTRIEALFPGQEG